MPAEKQEQIRGTIPVPDHSDLRGFSYRAPTNIQGYNDDPKSARRASRGTLKLKGQLYHRKGFWTSIRDFFSGKKESDQRPMSPELVNTQMEGAGSNSPTNKTDENFSVRPIRRDSLPKDRDVSASWPG